MMEADASKSARSRLLRRSHVKSRQGCRTCKLRRVRCDELLPACLNCTRLNRQCIYEKQSDTRGSPESSNARTQASYSAYGKPQAKLPRRSLDSLEPEVLEQELFLMTHICDVAARLESSEAHKFTVGTAEFPKFVRLAFAFESVRFAVLGISAEHLSLVQRSATWAEVGNCCRARSFAHLREAIRDFSQQNCDAVLVSSIVLCWQARDAQEYVQIMKGISSVLAAIRDRKYMSILPTFCADLDPPDEEWSNATKPDYLPLVSALESLKVCVGFCPELCKAVRELSVFVENLKRVPHNLSINNQLKIIYPVRWWFRFLPTRFLQQTDTDPWVMVVVAFYNLLALAITPVMPALASAYFTMAKARMIDATGLFVASLPSDQTTLGLGTPHSMMELALSLAREYSPKQKYAEQSLQTAEDVCGTGVNLV